MKDEKISDIIKDKNLRKDEALIRSAKEKAPYNQTLRSLEDRISGGSENIHFLYDRDAILDEKKFRTFGDAPEIGKVSLKSKKGRKRKKNVYDKILDNEVSLEKEGLEMEPEKEDIQEPTAEKEKDQKEEVKEAVQKEEVKEQSAKHWRDLGGSGNPELDDFTKWINSIDPRQASPFEKKKKKKNKKAGGKKKKKKEDESSAEIREKIDASVKVQGEIVSEHLAKLYIQQEHYGKALKMYEKLLLKNPEKSDFFAAQIQEIKRKL